MSGHVLALLLSENPAEGKIDPACRYNFSSAAEALGMLSFFFLVSASENRATKPWASAFNSEIVIEVMGNPNAIAVIRLCPPLEDRDLTFA
jgi:hypothetical protein